jgi:hypothetical protein
LGAKPAKRRIQFASIKQLENVESAARPKIQRYPGAILAIRAAIGATRTIAA